MPTESSPAEARCQSPFRPSCRAHPYLYAGVELGFEIAAAVAAEHLAVLGRALACRYEEAQERYRLVLRLKPDFAPALGNLGQVRAELGDFAEAERCFQRVLYLDPRHSEALVHMALLARRRGDERLAENSLRRLDKV